MISDHANCQAFLDRSEVEGRRSHLAKVLVPLVLNPGKGRRRMPARHGGEEQTHFSSRLLPLHPAPNIICEVRRRRERKRKKSIDPYDAACMLYAPASEKETCSHGLLESPPSLFFCSLPPLHTSWVMPAGCAAKKQCLKERARNDASRVCARGGKESGFPRNRLSFPPYPPAFVPPFLSSGKRQISLHLGGAASSLRYAPLTPPSSWQTGVIKGLVPCSPGYNICTRNAGGEGGLFKLKNGRRRAETEDPCHQECCH